MINGLVDALKSINNTAYNNNLAINSPNCAKNFLLTLVQIAHRLNQLCNGLRKLETDISTIYNYMFIDSLSNKHVRSTLIDPVDLQAILNNIQKAIPKYLTNAASIMLTFGHSTTF